MTKEKAVIILLLVSYLLGGQTKVIDSLYRTIPSAHDTVKCINYGKIARDIGANYPDSASALADSSLKYALRSGFKKGEANAYFVIGFVAFNRGKYDVCIDNFGKSLRIYEQQKNKNSIGNLNNALGNVYIQIGQVDLALKYYTRANEIARQEPRNRMQEGLTNSSLGIVLKEKKQYEEALKRFVEAKKIYKEIGHKQQEGTAYLNCAFTYVDLKNFDKAKEECLTGIEILKGLDDKYVLAKAYTVLSQIYKGQGKTEEAIKSLRVAYAINVTRNTLPELTTNSKSLAKLYAEVNDFKNSHFFLSEYIRYNDSLNNVTQRKLLADADAKYQTKEKEQQLVYKNLELEKSQSEVSQRNKLIFVFGGAIIIFVVLLFIVYRQFTEKRKANVLLVNKNEEIEKQKYIIEEKNKDITDSINYSRHIQQAIIPSVDNVKKALPSSFVIFQPKDIVSGDFYFLDKINDTIYLAVIDCTGHGVPGAMLSVFAHSSLKNIITNAKVSEDPAGILREMCSHFRTNLLSHSSGASLNDGVDMGLCIINRGKRKIIFAGAKNTLVKVNAGHLEKYEGNRWGISGTNSALQSVFTNHEITVKEGDKFYMHTDGIVDQFGGPKGKKFMQKKLNELFTADNETDMSRKGEFILRTFTEWKGTLEQIDDVTLIGFEI
ncbi:MAG: protein serine/threonine phosphatase [Bacteroidetes bacterium]|nr:protein serine/threonine phosphatase [Bacteroidota bacterium]